MPLVYRPTIKSAMLAAPFTSTLAQLLGEQGEGPGCWQYGVVCLHVVSNVPAIEGRDTHLPFPVHCAAICCSAHYCSRTAGVVVGKLALADEGSEAGHVCTMLMEALVVLLNHEVGRVLRAVEGEQPS